MRSSTPLAKPVFLDALRFWWKLGWISFGGTAAHIALMHEELVERKNWVSNEDFLHALSLCMLLPGPEAHQLAIYLGWKLNGKTGGIVAGVLFVLPSTFVLLLLSVIYVQFGNLPWIAAMFAGLRPGVVALVLLAIGRVAGRALNSLLQWSVCVGVFLALTLLHIPLPTLMLFVIFAGLILSRVRSSSLRHDERSKPTAIPFDWPGALRRASKVAAIGLGLWILPLVALRYLCPDTQFWTQLCFFFTRTAFVTVGGSYTVIPYVAHLAVGRFHWLGQAQMVDGFALAETTPGPLIIVVAFVGFMAGFEHFQHSIPLAILALLVTTFYTFLPCFLFVLAGAPFVEQTHGRPGVGMVLRLITALVVAAMLDLTLFLIHGVIFTKGTISLPNLDVFALLWAAVSLFLLRVFKTTIPMMIVLSLLFGVARWFFHLA
jgi:chromate transporter, chromate ion transporter (CHR) family